MRDLPPFVVINLDRDADRLAHMQREFDKLGLTFQRFAAVNGANLPEHLRGYFAPADANPLSPGETGCYASHLAICRAIVDGQLPAPLFVIEDDIEFPPDFVALMQDVLSKLPADWDIVRLANEAKRIVAPLARVTGDRRLVRFTTVPPSTGASLISETGARKFLKQQVRSLPVDQDLRRVWEWDLNTYGVMPPPIRRDIFDTSSIDAMAQTGFRSRSARLARMRRQRATETWPRQKHGMATFGALTWLRAELTSAVASLIPKRRRAAFLKRASDELTGV